MILFSRTILLATFSYVNEFVGIFFCIDIFVVWLVFEDRSRRWPPRPCCNLTLLSIFHTLDIDLDVDHYVDHIDETDETDHDLLIDRSDHPGPNLPFWDVEIIQVCVVQIDPAQETCCRSCRLYCSHQATLGRSYTSYRPYRSYTSYTSYRLYRSYISGIYSICPERPRSWTGRNRSDRSNRSSDRGFFGGCFLLRQKYFVWLRFVSFVCCLILCISIATMLSILIGLFWSVCLFVALCADRSRRWSSRFCFPLRLCYVALKKIKYFWRFVRFFFVYSADDCLVCCLCRSIATLAITTLLKTGTEGSVDRLMKQISSFMNEIADEFKIVVVKAIRQVSQSVSHPVTNTWCIPIMFFLSFSSSLLLCFAVFVSNLPVLGFRSIARSIQYIVRDDRFGSLRGGSSRIHRFFWSRKSTPFFRDISWRIRTCVLWAPVDPLTLFCFVLFSRQIIGVFFFFFSWALRSPFVFFVIGHG